MLRYELLPEHMRDGIKLYVEEGVEPGDFAYAVLCNDLVGAYGRADATNTARMRDWANFLYNEMPMGSWGSKEKVAAWMKARNLVRTA